MEPDALLRHGQLTPIQRIKAAERYASVQKDAETGLPGRPPGNKTMP